MSAALQSLAIAISPANTAAILARCTLWPWIITVHYVRKEWRRDGGSARYYEQRIEILQATLADMPEASDLVPEGCEFQKADVFPATRFDDMAIDVRQRYKQQYRAFLCWRKARAADKSPAELVPWVDFDPVDLDETCERWARPACRLAGD